MKTIVLFLLLVAAMPGSGAVVPPVAFFAAPAFLEVCGHGTTKAAAYADALSRLPDGAVPGAARFWGSDGHWSCWLKYEIKR